MQKSTIDKEKMKIYYPTQDFLDGRHKNVVWYTYLLEGLKQVGEVILSKEMSDISTCDKGNHVSALEVEINGVRKRCYYDWSDFMVDHRDRAGR